jgi:hypothetical protein
MPLPSFCFFGALYVAWVLFYVGSFSVRIFFYKISRSLNVVFELKYCQGLTELAQTKYTRVENTPCYPLERLGLTLMPDLSLWNILLVREDQVAR